jgi:membrane fusion protein, multidrug efflux system
MMTHLKSEYFSQLFSNLRRSHQPATAFVASLSMLVFIGACSKSEPPPTAPRPALAYKITNTSGVDLDVYSGEIRARQEADHAFRVGGKIQKRLVDAGATVKRGQALAQLDPQDVRLAADAARAQVSAQQTEAEFAEAELKRFRDLFQKGFVSQSALDQKINLANAARARLDAQKASANVSLNQAGYATLLAETDGVVTQVMAEAGQVVAAGQAVMKVANPRERELAITVPEAKIGDFRSAASLKGAAKGESTPNRAIRVHLWSAPEKVYPGRVREIAGAADPVTRTYAVRVSLTEVDDAIGLGMSAFAAFAGTDAAGSFSVPLSSVYAKGSTTGVWVIAADGKVTLKPVTVIQYRERTALVSSQTVKPGDTIVAAGVHKLRDGEVVKAIVDTEVKGDGKVALAPASPLPTEEPKREVALLDKLFR